MYPVLVASYCFEKRARFFAPLETSCLESHAQNLANGPICINRYPCACIQPVVITSPSNILRWALVGKYVNFGVFELYNDQAFHDAMSMYFQLLVKIPLADLMVRLTTSG